MTQPMAFAAAAGGIPRAWVFRCSIWNGTGCGGGTPAARVRREAVEALVNPELLATPEIPSSQFAHPRLGEK